MFDVFYCGTKPGLFAFEQPAQSLEEAARLSRTTHYWYIYGGNDYTGFDFDYVPVPWEAAQIHTWPSQWQKDAGVYLANKNTVHNKEWHYRTEQMVTRLPNRSLWQVPDNIDDSEFDYSWHPNTAEHAYEYHFPTQWQREGGPVYPGPAGKKFMTSQKIKAGATQIFYMDFVNPEHRAQFDTLQLAHPTIKNTRYVDNHLSVFKRIMNLATTEYVWIISSLCDYTDFDFTWHPADDQKEMVHCFANTNSIEKRGDTFYVHVPSFTQQMIELELLDWFNVINYCDDQHVTRFAIPVVVYPGADLITAIKDYTFTTPYAVFTGESMDILPPQVTINTCLWTEKDRVATSLVPNKSLSIIPRDIKKHIKTQVYDYPYLVANKASSSISDELDIIYISNGEPDELKWLDWTQAKSNREVKWVHGVNGRTAAYQEAARRSSTEWFLAVFAKLEVTDNRAVWEFQPDYWQGPKHYIFNAQNPVNGLVYGHQGIIAYNKSLVLANNDPGIDFTLSQPHESVPLLSGIAHFNQDAWMTWRTAFREVLKLRLAMDTQPTLETEHRLNAWLTKAEGNFAAECLQGAADAVEYYESVAGDYELLKLSFEWQWLRTRFDAKY